MTSSESPGGAASAARPKVHFIGVCGKGMGGIAAALARAGWRITGSDENTYPPMCDYLDANGVPVDHPYQPENVPPDTDVVVVGKRIREDNPELKSALAAGLNHLSFPAFLREHFLTQSRNAVVAGGVGKTTTTAMLAWILEHAGLAPDYFIGGQPGNLEHPARWEGAGICVLEGDEYASGFDDLRPKFHYYEAEVAIVTNVLEDHPDLYKNLDAVLEVFHQLAGSLPDQGRLILPDSDPHSAGLASSAKCESITTGFGPDADFPIRDLELKPEHSRFSLDGQGFDLPLAGKMNVMNAAMAFLAGRHFDVSPKQAAEAVAAFQGVGLRQSVEEAGGCMLVRDKATHPFALRELFASVRQRFPGRRLVSFIQPRATGGRQWVYQKDLPSALATADLVLAAPPYEHNPGKSTAWEGGEFSVDLMVEETCQLGGNAVALPAESNTEDSLHSFFRSGDVVVFTLPEQDKHLFEMARKAIGEV